MLTPTPTAFQIPHLVSFFLSPFARSISSIQLTHCFCHRYLNKRRLNGESATAVGPKRSGETAGSDGTPAKRCRGRPKGSKNRGGKALSMVVVAGPSAPGTSG